MASLISPFGRTTRRHYWLAVVSLAIGAFAVSQAIGSIRPVAAVSLIAFQIILLVATLRRLHDTNWSRWWALLYLFPASITLDLFHVRIGESDWQFVDFSAIVRLTPVLIGLFAVSRPSTADPALEQVFA